MMHRNHINKPTPNQPFIKSDLSIRQRSKKEISKRSLTSWSSRYDELKLYKKKYGDCNVSRHWAQNPSLGQWVQSQRNNYRYWKRGRGKTNMTQERFDALNNLGFNWVLQNHSVSKAWSERLEELKSYAEIYGHCNIPQHWPQNPSLGQWVATQRAEYKKWKKQKHSAMTNDRKNALEAIGFNWYLRKRSDCKTWNGQGNRRKQGISSTVVSQKKSPKTVPDKSAPQDTIQYPCQTSITIPNTTDNRETDTTLLDGFTAFGNIIDNSHSLTNYDTGINLEPQSFLPDLKVHSGEISFLEVFEYDKQGLSVATSYMSDISDGEMAVEDLCLGDESQIEFDDDFFQRLEYSFCK